MIYLYFEIKKKNAMWIFGVAMAVMYIIIFGREKLYAAMGLHLYYLAVSIYGWFQWKRDSVRVSSGAAEGKDEVIALRKLSLMEILLSCCIAAGLYFVFAFLLSSFTGDPKPELDSVVTALSILGTYWLSRSFIWQWAVWIVTDAVAVCLYALQGLYPTAGLYLVYIVAAVFGFYYWKKKGKAE